MYIIIYIYIYIYIHSIINFDVISILSGSIKFMCLSSDLMTTICMLTTQVGTPAINPCANLEQPL